MHRQGFDLQLTQYDQRGWRATFYTTGHGALADERDSPIPPGGSRLDATGLPRRHDPLQIAPLTIEAELRGTPTPVHECGLPPF
jgi:hypothetical protein